MVAVRTPVGSTTLPGDRADGRRPGVVSLPVFFLVSGAMASALGVVLGGPRLLALYAAFVAAALVLTAATSILASWRRTGRLDLRRWWPARQPGAGPIGLRVWPSTRDEPWRVQRARARWPVAIEADGAADLAEVDRRIAVWFPLDGTAAGDVKGAVRRRTDATSFGGADGSIDRRLDGTVEVQLRRTQPAGTLVEGTVTATTTGSHFEGWALAAKRGRWDSGQGAVQSLVLAGLWLSVAVSFATSRDATGAPPIRLAAGVAGGGIFLLALTWLRLLRLLVGTADASQALERDLAAVLDGRMVEVGDANPDAPPDRFRRPPEQLTRKPWPTTAGAVVDDETVARQRIDARRRAAMPGMIGLGVLLLVLVPFVLGAVFADGSAPVDPADPPPGRVVYTNVRLDGTLGATWVDCPSLAQTIGVEIDDVCVAAVRNSVIAVVVLGLLEVLLVVAIVWLHRSRHGRWSPRAIMVGDGESAG